MSHSIAFIVVVSFLLQIAAVRPYEHANDNAALAAAMLVALVTIGIRAVGNELPSELTFLAVLVAGIFPTQAQALMNKWPPIFSKFEKFRKSEKGSDVFDLF